jgi:hypothetical protein
MFLWFYRCLAVFVVLSIVAAAPLHFSNVFGSHQVVQRAQAVPFWGWGGVGAVESVWGSEKQSTTADASGFWKLTFAARAASSVPSSVIVCTLTVPRNLPSAQ